jgi:hypothetical protein
MKNIIEKPLKIHDVRLLALIEHEEELIEAEILAKKFNTICEPFELGIKRARFKGALYSAASKNHKRKIIISWLQNVVFDKKIDITTSLAREIIKKSLGISININRLNDNFGTPGRDASNKTDGFKNLTKIVHEIKSENLDEKINETLKEVMIDMKSLANFIKKTKGEETKYSKALDKEEGNSYGGL